MTKMISVRLEKDLVERVDDEVARAGITRAAAIAEAMTFWVERRRYAEAIEREHAGYDARPVEPDEFDPLLKARAWPK